MSVFFDCLWWWRAEFDNKANPYAEAGADPSSVLPGSYTGLRPTTSERQDPTIDSTTFDMSHVPDWDWDILCNTHWDWQASV